MVLKDSYIRTRILPAELRDLQLYEREMCLVLNYYYLVTVVMWTYKDKSMCKTDKGWILIAIRRFQFKI